LQKYSKKKNLSEEKEIQRSCVIFKYSEFDKKFNINNSKSIFKYFIFTKIQNYLLKTLQGKTLRHMVASSASSFTKIRGKDNIFLTTFLLAAHSFQPEPSSHDLHRLHGIPP
jgi:hypothetical protein